MAMRFHSDIVVLYFSDEKKRCFPIKFFGLTWILSDEITVQTQLLK